MDFAPDFTRRTFSAGDYVVFALMFLVSTLIGCFYFYKDRKKEDRDEFLIGGRSLSPYPVGLSLSVSVVTGTLVLGTPGDVYAFGTTYIWLVIGFFLAAVVASEIYVPIFYGLRLRSAYEYLEYRFHRSVRILGAITYIVHTVIYLGFVIYAPAYALNAVTGWNIWGAITSTSFVCIIYTALGGLKAVIWIDVAQMIFIVFGFVSVLIQGSLKAGGYEVLWKKCIDGGRINFGNFNPDPRLSNTFWSLCVGGGLSATSLYAVNQASVQRFMSCRSATTAKAAAFLNWAGLLILYVLAMLVGVEIYGYYHKCDPLQFTHLTQRDQLLPFLVMDLFQNNPGAPGLIVASIYSACLSSVSTSLIALSSVTVTDIFSPWWDFSEERLTWIARGSVVFYGILGILFAFLTSRLEGLLKAALAIHGLLGGPMLGLFTLGILFPCANPAGAIVGLLVGVAMNAWVFTGALDYSWYIEQFQGFLPLRTDMCPMTETSLPSNATTPLASLSTAMSTHQSSTTGTVPAVVEIYSMSFWYLSAWGFTFTIVVGLLTSLVTCGQRSRKDVDPRFVHPFFSHWLCIFLPKSAQKGTWCGVPHDFVRSNTKTTENEQGSSNATFRDERF
ncbi:sodium-coupled monocarboxylate transporter 1-like [Clavelina lepadiformis]|uniref:sodium-coupled monocarboxylate transporter 1-like n=1 Tax=Clavelina lepadiformis TaxID=159417 RepID=UPI004041D6C6